MVEFPSGWFPDYDDDQKVRFWDGKEWTDRTAPRVSEAPAPPPPPRVHPLKSTAEGQDVPPVPTVRPDEPRSERIGRLPWSAWSRRTRLVTAIAAGVVVCAIGGIAASVIVHQQSAAAAQRVAAVKAKQKASADAAEVKRAAEAELKQNHDNAVAAGKTRIADAQKLYTDSAAWGDPGARQRLQHAIEAANKMLATPEKSTTEHLLEAFGTVASASTDVGTQSDAQDRQYQALVAQGVNAGQLITSTGREYCTYLTQNSYTPDNVISNLWGDGMNASRADVAAVRVYCPAYGAALSAAMSGVFDGTHLPGTSGFTAGTWHTYGGVSNCYWELSDGHGNIADNNYINAAPSGVTVNVDPDQTFVTQGCGMWVKG